MNWRSNQLFIQAAKDGDANTILKLIPHTSTKSHDQALLVAAAYGHAECLKLIIPITDPKKDNSYALETAAENGHIECVKLLIPVSNPQSNHSQALRVSAQNGCHECVKLLIPVSNPQDCGSLALEIAVRKNQKKCIEYLIPVSDSSWVLSQLTQRHQDLLQQCIDEHEIQQQKERICSELDHTLNHVSLKRKI